jgi:hypothetical protein
MLLNPRLPTADAGSTWTQTSDLDFNNGTLDNLTIKGNGEDAELRNLFSLPQGWYEKKLSIKPQGRIYHKIAPIYGTDKVLLFGGLINGPPLILLDETWIYDYSNNNWTKMNPSGSIPDARVFEMATIWGTDKVILFGSFNDLSQIWTYDLSGNNWTRISLVGTDTPTYGAYYGFAPIYGTDKVILYGGYLGGTNYHNENWVFDYSKKTWSNMTTPGNKPSPRSGHVMASIWGTDKVLLYGGSFFTGTGTINYNDTWIYDLSDNKWTEKDPIVKLDFYIRHKMVTILNSDSVLMWGDGTSDNSTYLYDLSENTWTARYSIVYSSPPWRSHQAMAPIYGTDCVVLFGGGFWYDDTWLYKHFLISENGTYVSKPFDTGSNSSFKTINWFANTPAKTSLKFQLRTADNESNLATQAFIGPDGSNATYYTTSGTGIWPGHHGARWVQYKAYLNMSIHINYDHPVQLKEVTILYNCLPKTFVDAPTNGSISTNNKPEFIWTFDDHDSERQEAFQILIDDDIDFQNVAYDTGELITAEQSWLFPSSTNYTTLPDGTWYWKVRTMDEDGDWAEFSNPQVLKIDTQMPGSAVNMPINNGFYNNLSGISGEANDAQSGVGLSTIEIAIKRVRDSYYWNGTSWIASPNWLLVNGTSSWIYYINNISWLSGARYNVQSRATDNATNIEQPSPGNLFIIDLDGPVSKIESPKDNVWLNKLNTISGTSIDIGGSGVDKVRLCIKCIEDYNLWDDGAKENEYWNGQNWTSEEAWVTTESTEQWYYDSSAIELTTGNNYTICVQAVDNTGNLELSGQEITFIYDDQPPEVLETYINHGDNYTTVSMVTLTIQADDYGSGISDMALSTDSVLWSDWEPFASERNFTLPPMDGEKIVHFKVRDIAGNVAEPVFNTIILDKTPPQELFIALNENAEYTNSNHIILTLNAIDTCSGLKDMSFSHDGVIWTDEIPFASERAYTLTLNDGVKTVYFRVRDNAENIAQPVFDSIILDRTKPHSLSILINKGAAETNGTAVIIGLFALDNLSGVHQMSFSNDGINWNAWENYIEKRPYYLAPGLGIKIIYFKVMDYAGNIAEPANASIVLNSPPELSKRVPTEVSSTELEYWIILFILIIILIIIFILGLVLFKKQEKRIKQKLLLTGAVTVKREALPGITGVSEQVPPATTPDRLAGTVTPERVTLPSIFSTSTPQLAESTQVQQPTIAQPTTQPSQVPQLPPAKPQEKEPTVNKTTQTPAPTVVSPPSTPTPTIVQEPEE